MRNSNIKRCVLMLNVPARMKTEKKLCVLAPEYLAKLVFLKKKPYKITEQEYSTHV